MSKFTLVQHSGWVRTGHYDFRQAVEERGLTHPAEIARVELAGGVLFRDYSAAMDAAERENYPDPGMGLIPRCRGHFSALHRIEDSPIYIPPKET